MRNDTKKWEESVPRKLAGTHAITLQAVLQNGITSQEEQHTNKVKEIASGLARKVNVRVLHSQQNGSRNESRIDGNESGIDRLLNMFVKVEADLKKAIEADEPKKLQAFFTELDAAVEQKRIRLFNKGDLTAEAFRAEYNQSQESVLEAARAAKEEKVAIVEAIRQVVPMLEELKDLAAVKNVDPKKFKAYLEVFGASANNLCKVLFKYPRQTLGDGYSQTHKETSDSALNCKFVVLQEGQLLESEVKLGNAFVEFQKKLEHGTVLSKLCNKHATNVYTRMFGPEELLVAAAKEKLRVGGECYQATEALRDSAQIFRTAFLEAKRDLQAIGRPTASR
jgi:hypothetical protein